MCYHPDVRHLGFMYLKDSIENYLKWKAGHTDKAPIAYRLRLERFLEFYGNKIVGNIHEDTITKFVDLLKVKYAIANVAYHVTVLKNFFRYCNARGWSKLDPFLIRRPRYRKAKRVAATWEEITKMCSLCNEWEFTGLTKILILRFLWDTGVRVSELCSLNVNNIETHRTYCQLKTAKSTDPEEYIMWSKETHKLLIRYLGTRISLNQTQPLFITLKGRGRITSRTIERWFEELRTEAKILKPITPHVVRHGKAHDILQKGGTVKDIQVILRHSEDNPAASWVYIHLDKGEFMKVAEKFVS